MVSNALGDVSSFVWFANNDYSNYMTGERKMFSTLDESQRVSVHLGDDKEMAVLGVEQSH